MNIQLHIPSFLLVFGAMIGNAQIMYIDLFLFVIFPTWCVVMVLKGPATLKKLDVLILALAAIFLAIATAQSTYVDPPYNPLYVLWPVKAFLLAVALRLSLPARWPVGNHLLWLVFVLILLFFARIESGRMVSIFGPNMLYRIFGLLYIVSALQILDASTPRSKFHIFCAGLGAASIVATGSVGGIMILALPVLLTGISARKALYFLGVSCILFAVVFVMNGLQLQDLSSIQRLVYKLGNLSASSRLIGWQTILTYEFSILGRSYQDFYHIWSFGYEYPHNAFVELYAYYGLLGCFLIVGLILAIRAGARTFGIFYYAFIPVLCGAMMSGDLSENFAILSFAFLTIRSTPKRSLGHGLKSI